MNRKIVLGASALLTAMVLTAGSLSYFSDTESVENVVTLGNVSLTLTEPNFDEATDGTKEIEAMPGNRIDKDPTVKNDGDTNAWVFVKAEIQWDDGTGTLTAPSFSDLSIAAESGVTGYKLNTSSALFAVNAIMAPQAEKAVFANTTAGGVSYTMTIPGTWTAEYMGHKLNIQVTAYAIQADNLTQAEAAEALGLSGYLA